MAAEPLTPVNTPYETDIKTLYCYLFYIVHCILSSRHVYHASQPKHVEMYQ